MGVHHQKTWDPKWGWDHQQGFYRIEWRYHWQNPSRLRHWNGKITHVPFSVVEAKGKGCWCFFSGGEESHGFGIFLRKTVKGQSISIDFWNQYLQCFLEYFEHPWASMSIPSRCHEHYIIISSHQGIIPFPFDPRVFLESLAMTPDPKKLGPQSWPYPQFRCWFLNHSNYQISQASGLKAFQPEKKRMWYFQVCRIFMK